MTSLSCGLVTRQQVLVSTVNISSVDDHKENKIVLNGRLRSFGAFVPISNSNKNTPWHCLNGEMLSSFLLLGGANL